MIFDEYFSSGWADGSVSFSKVNMTRDERMYDGYCSVNRRQTPENK